MLGPSRPWRGQPAVRTLPSAAAGTGETNGLPARPVRDGLVTGGRVATRPPYVPAITLWLPTQLGLIRG